MLCFREQENRTSVVHEAKTMRAQMLHDWGQPVSIPSSDPGLCLYARHALRGIYSEAPQTRERCFAFLPEDHHETPQPFVQCLIACQPEPKQPWVVAVHVRPGDINHFRHGFRSIPQSYFSAAVKAVLRGIAVSDPAAHVSASVFSEGPDTTNGLQLPDEHGDTFTWDTEQESCVNVGLTCSQVRGMKLQTDATSRAFWVRVGAGGC